jgi:transposase-like protein
LLPSLSTPPKQPPGLTMSKHTRQKQVEVLTALSVNGGHITRTAKQCGVSRDAVYRFIEAAKQERGDITTKTPAEHVTPRHVDGELLSTNVAKEGAALPLPAYLNPDVNKPLLYQVEQRCLEMWGAAMDKIAASRYEPTTQDAYTLLRMAELASRMRLGTDRLSVPQAGQGETVIVEWVRAERRG